MRQFGLIGYPLGHSFSRGFFSEKFANEGLDDCRYDNFPIEKIVLLPGLIHENSNLCGLNVTIPYKEQVIPFLAEIDPEAAEIGSVNTVHITRRDSGTYLKGYNTDAYGFSMSIKPLLLNGYKKALVLGTGGSSKAVVYALQQMQMEVICVSRKPAHAGIRSYADLSEALIAEAEIIVNATPAGMYPQTDTCPPIPYEHLTGRHLLFDLVYNPDQTLFMKKGIDKGARVTNGLKMLHLQAEKSWEIWNQ